MALLTIGLATGATTTMFSVVDTLLIRPVPYPQAERLDRRSALRWRAFGSSPDPVVALRSE